jgi:hypothetical protein
MVSWHMSDRIIATLDFEANSLDETGYPIEVAFVVGTPAGITGRFSTLIKPRPQWKGPTAWSQTSQAAHGITRDDLDDGLDADAVCDALDAALGGLSVVVDGGSFDAFWLKRLFDGRPCAFTLDHLTRINAAAFIARKRTAMPSHRALPDAEWLWSTVAELYA